MAIVRAVKSGNWSDTTVWNTGALPTSADDVYSNTFTVTIDVSPTVLSISNASATGVTAGGSFVPTNGITLTCTATTGVDAITVNWAFDCNLGAGQSCTLVANRPVDTGRGASIIRNSALGTLNVIGNFGGIANSAAVIGNTGAGTVNITGNLTGGLSGGTVVNSGGGTVNLTAAVTGGASGGPACLNSGAGAILNITGNVIAQSGPGVISNAQNTVNIVGSITASSSQNGLVSSNTSANIALSGPFLASSNSVNPIYCAAWRWISTQPATYYQIRSANLSVIRSLYTADSVGGNPSARNVRSGTVYGPAGELTGTCAVPPAGSVALGVPVDATTGTAYLSQSDIAAAATTALSAASAVTLNQPITTLTTPNSIGERLKNAATVATVSQQISDVFSSRQ